VARLLADRLTPSVHLHTDDFYGFIRQGFVPPYLPGSQRQNEVVIGVLSGCAFGYAAGGYRVVLDGVVGPWFIDPFRAAAEASGIPLDYVVLRPERDVVLARATRRESGLTEPGHVLKMYEQYAVDSGRLTAEQTATAVLAGVESGSFRLP
jgi:hypothetical protein